MDELQSALLPALFGSVFQELLYWYDLRSKLSTGKYDEMLRAPSYWILTALMTIGSAYGTYVWFSGQSVGPKDYMIVGAAFPLLFKHVASAAARRQKLGARSVIRSYFRMG